MRLLALQTNVKAFEKQFMVDGEEHLLCTCHHPFAFFFPFLWQFIIAIAVLFMAGAIVSMVPGMTGSIIAAAILTVWGIYSVIRLFNALISWRYNFLIVTTIKVVVITQRSFVYQNVYPIHLENITSTRFESQFFGIGRCGTLHINLAEREGGSTKDITLPYMPTPDIVAGIIENSVALIKRRQNEGQKQEEQKETIQAVKEKAEQAKGAVVEGGHSDSA